MAAEHPAAQGQDSILFQMELERPGTWHSHKDGFWLFVWNEDAKRWECSGCGEPWARAPNVLPL